MAGTLPRLTNLVENGVLLAVDPHLEELEEVARSQPLDPKLVSRGTPEDRLALAQRSLESQLVDVAEDEDLAGRCILGNRGNDLLLAGRDLAEFAEVPKS
jgi:hypothetical protein